MYICPVCSEKLLLSEKSFVCKNRHNFDISASGYVNLLTGSGKNHGDDAEMISARRRFLCRGYYSPLCDAVIEECKKAAPSNLLDAGCGEGYYTKRIKEALPGCKVYGFDISKKAAEKAAKLGGLNISVASAYHMPYENGCFDCAVNIFSPLAQNEYLRVLKPGGTLILAVPSPDHLSEIKAAVYDAPHTKEMKDDGLDGFVLTNKIELKYGMDLDRDSLLDLFAMTPYVHKTSEKDRQKLYEKEKMIVTASFTVITYKAQKF